MTIRRILLALWLFGTAALQAQTEQFDALYARLAAHGFENLRISATAASGLAIAFENRIYRHDLKAAGEVLRIVSRTDSTWRSIHLQPCTRGVPRGQISVDGAAYRRFIAGEMASKEFARTLRIGAADPEPRAAASRWRNRSFRKIDVNISIGQQIQLGQYDDRLKLYGELQPGLRSQPWRGALAQVEAFIPVWDEIGWYDEGPRLARASISQLFRLPADSYAALQGGIFQPERWGLSAQAAKFWFGRSLLTGAQLDNTGFFYHDEGSWYYSKMHLWTWKVYAQYFLPWTDLMLGVDYSTYLLGDKGTCFTLRRTFAETDIALYYAITDYDRFGGVQFRIPLPTQKRMKPCRVRLTWPNQYSWGYRATSEATRYDGILQTGLIVDSGFSLTEFVKYLTPEHVRSSVAGWREGN
jgi:hypothetical protein